MSPPPLGNQPNCWVIPPREAQIGIPRSSLRAVLPTITPLWPLVFPSFHAMVHSWSQWSCLRWGIPKQQCSENSNCAIRSNHTAEIMMVTVLKLMKGIEMGLCGLTFSKGTFIAKHIIQFKLRPAENVLPWHSRALKSFLHRCTWTICQTMSPIHGTTSTAVPTAMTMSWTCPS